MHRHNQLQLTLPLRLIAVRGSMAWHSRGQRPYAEPMMSQYYELPSFYSPGAVRGAPIFIRVGAGGRLRWVGIDRAPVSVARVSDMPFKIGKRRLRSQPGPPA